MMRLSSAEKTWKKWDFIHPKRISFRQEKAVLLLLEKYTSHLSTFFSSFWHSDVHVSLCHVEQIPLLKYWRSLGNPTFLTLFEMAPESPCALLEVPAPIVYAIIHRMLGYEANIPSERHALNPLEMGLFRKFMNSLVRDLHDAWEPIVPSSFLIQSLHTHLPTIMPMNPSQLCIAAYYSISIHHFKGIISLCFPSMALSPYDHSLEQFYLRQAPTAQEEPMISVPTLLETIGIELRAVIGNAMIYHQDLQQLQEGDILDLGISAYHSLDLKVENDSLFKVFPGLLGKQKAVFLHKATQKEPSS